MNNKKYVVALVIQRIKKVYSEYTSLEYKARLKLLKN
jgi:hypothetical protein